MSRGVDKRIAEYLGCKHRTVVDDDGEEIAWEICKPDRRFELWQSMPWWETSDSDAITLLPVLVERGYEPMMEYDNGGWCLTVWKLDTTYYDADAVSYGNATISAAICNAIIQLIEKEEGK